MDYISLDCSVQPNTSDFRDILSQALAEIGFESFEETGSGIKAYVPSHLFNEDAVVSLNAEYISIFTFQYHLQHIPSTNWNAVWESNFDPVIVNKDCVVRADFHELVDTFKYDLVINPKMSFGTGHHETTSLMLQWVLEMERPLGKVLDMGCGTGVLAIMASKLDATSAIAVDIDAQCIENTNENIIRNNVQGILAFKGELEHLAGKTFNLIMANINRNVLISHLPTYASCLNAGGHLLMSGFYDGKDLEVIKMEAKKNGLVFKGNKVKNNWTAAYFIKNNVVDAKGN